MQTAEFKRSGNWQLEKNAAIMIVLGDDVLIMQKFVPQNENEEIEQTELEDQSKLI